MAFGDGGNDMTMLRQAGTGIAMGNAEDKVKAVADYGPIQWMLTVFTKLLKNLESYKKP